MGQLIRRGAEIGARGGFDAKRVAAEIHRIEIHGEYLLLIEYNLQLDGNYPFLGFHHQEPHPGNVSEQSCRILGAHTEEVLGQLLSDGAGTSSPPAGHILDGCKEPLEIYTMMMIEAFVLGIYQCVDEHRRYLVVLHRRAVFAEEASELHAVGTIHLGSLAHHGIFNVLEAR